MLRQTSAAVFLYKYIYSMIERGVEIDGYIYHPDYDGEQIPVIEKRESVSILKRIVLSPGDLFDLNFCNNVEVRLSRLLNVWNLKLKFYNLSLLKIIYGVLGWQWTIC